MTSEKNLTEEFFRVFGIEPKKLFSARQGINPDAVIYPEITSNIILQLICINSQKGGIEIFNRKNIEELKNSMLQHCIDRLGYALNKEKYKQQIQQLFSEWQ